jgi:hypothetical protein
VPLSGRRIIRQVPGHPPVSAIGGNRQLRKIGCHLAEDSAPHLAASLPNATA